MAKTAVHNTHMNNPTYETLKKRVGELGLTEAEIADKSGVPQSTVHRIITGASRDPRRSNVLKIASALNLTEAQVYGENGSHINTPAGTIVENRVPLISWTQAGDACNATDPFEAGDTEESIPCPVQHSKRAFALKVQGSSMEPRFHEGEVIVVDPNASSDPGRFVIAKKNGDKAVTFKQLMADGGEYYLKALNPEWPNRIMRMNEGWDVCGVVICKMEIL